MKNTLTLCAFAAAAAVAVVGLAMYISVSNWNECREHFSFLYCLTNRR